MGQQQWTAVDDYTTGAFAKPDEALDAAKGYDGFAIVVVGEPA